MKKLERQEMKNLKGGINPVGGACKCGNVSATVYHCFGTVYSCSDPTEGGCPPNTTSCHEYCGVSSNSGSNCWL